jgi:hypothetical protein
LSTYRAGFVPDAETREEFARLEKSLNEAQPSLELVILHAEPERIRPGMVVNADGTDWDPGSGEGTYRRDITNTSWVPTWVGGGSGTVTTVSVVSANGFAGTVATAATTPAITLTTTLTGLLKGNGTAMSAATAGTDYLAPPAGTAILKANSGGALANATAGADYSAGTAALGTGIVKTTTGTGALTVAVAGDFPTLNQNTTGTASNVTGTVAVANGGTGDTGTAWSTYTPTVASSSGSITTLGTVTGRYKQIGKTVFLSIVIPITTNGTGAGFISATLPGGMSAASHCTLAGHEDLVTGKSMRIGLLTSATSIEILTYDNNYPGVDGARIVVSGVIEIA